MAIEHESPRSANDPNRGLNVKVFLAIVAVGIVVIGIVLSLIVHEGSNAVPKPTQKTGPSSNLSSPNLARPKPSPLHPGALQASAKASQRP